MYLILHAFSRRNAGDGLLVDLTLELMTDAGIDRSDCTIMALDAESFADLGHVIQAPGEPAARVSLNLLAAGAEVARSSIRRSTIDRLVRQATGIIAVGGGYLVADSPVRQLGVLLNHFAQVRSAARSGKPCIYLPQSIGPLHSPVGSLLKRELRRLDRLYVRDDQSMAELPWSNVRRCGDLAVMKLARSLATIDFGSAGSGQTAIVARDLPNAGPYRQQLLRLATLAERPLWAVQADSAGRRSDRAFYEAIGVEQSGSLTHILETSKPDVVISVRLHGAIAAMLNGVPAIHLAYERKGWGAYEDLGIAEYAHDARAFDPGKVAEQASALSRDPRSYWDQIGSSAARLREQYAALVADVRERLAN